MTETKEELQRRRSGVFWGRHVSIKVGAAGEDGLKWTGDEIRISGSVTLTRRRRPNKAKFSLWNLSEDSVSILKDRGSSIVVEVGHRGMTSQIFAGNIDKVNVKTGNELDSVSEIEAAAGRNLYNRAKLSVSYAPPLTNLDLLRRLAESAAVPIESIPSDLDVLNYPQGFSDMGLLRDLLDVVSEDSGLDWTIQSGRLVFSREGEAINGESVVVSSANGTLLSKPERKRKAVKFKALLNPKIVPSRLVRLESSIETGWFVPTTVTHEFDSGYDNAFSTVVEATERKPRRS